MSSCQRSAPRCLQRRDGFAENRNLHLGDAREARWEHASRFRNTVNRCPPKAEVVSSNLAGCASLSHKIRHLESWRFVRAMLVEFAEALRKQREANIGVARRRTRRSKRAVHGGFTASAIDRQTPSLTRETSLRYLLGDAPVAQLDRAPPSEGGGPAFESRRVRHLGTALGTPKPTVLRLMRRQACAAVRFSPP